MVRTNQVHILGYASVVTEGRGDSTCASTKRSTSVILLVMKTIADTIDSVVAELFDLSERPAVVVTRPEPQFGDFATNIALQLAKPLGKNPRLVAEEIAERLRTQGSFHDVSVAGPGFINVRLTDSALLQMLDSPPQQTYAGQTIVTEYSDPNPFKVLHAGHLYTTLVGDGISRLLEVAGGTVHRVNFGGDVGLHVGKTMWAILQELGGENPQGLQQVEESKRLEWVSALYVKGNNAYDDDEAAKAQIIELNKRVYQLHRDGDKETPFAQIYWTCREW
ncbi:arginine--tRNA ligase, partial [Candidatus Saccharibacteria bacterium]